MTPDELVRRLNVFYDLSARVIFELDGTLDKLVGDQVMAFFGAPFRREAHAQRAVLAAHRIVAGVLTLGEGEPLAVGAGVATGDAFVGNVGGTDVSDFTVLGDTVNVAARLQGAAQAGEIVVTEAAYAEVANLYPDAPIRHYELKGKAAPVAARVLTVEVVGAGFARSPLAAAIAESGLGAATSAA